MVEDKAKSKPSQAKDMPTKSEKSPWNPLSIGFNGVGIIVGLCLMMVGGIRAHHFLDRFVLRYLGETKGRVLSLDVVKGEDGKTRYATTILLGAMGHYPSAKVRVFDRRVYDYIRHRYHPPRQLEVRVFRVHRVLSGQAGIAEVGPLRLLHAPKSAELIIYLGLFVMGGAICFTSLRDLRKRWLRRRLPTKL